MVPLCIGVFIAAEPIHGLAEWVAFANGMTGDAPPALLINSGLGLIGLRGAIE